MDLIILVVYIICMTYIIAQAIFSLDNQTKFVAEAKFFEAQLEEKKLGDKPLKDLVSVGFKFEFRYKSNNQPKTLIMTIENKSPDHYIYVDWDSSSITTYDPNFSRRVIRVAPDKRITDLDLPQVPSAIPPKLKLATIITAEDVFKLSADGNTLELKNDLIDLEKLNAVSKILRTPQYIKDINFNFKERRKPIEFYLRLMLRMTNVLHEDGNDRFQQVAPTYGREVFQTMVVYKFTVSKMFWVDQIPWNPQK
ncbi:MAG: hypothetical protein KME11_08250 [Timaviella obliquedivisa GSE-PSE-MK23-08B]|jgi:hypothetical protein|nr:hypothetical protein [Timaviella obliquedivisa GSE-PSE-MK23-08B]